MRMSLQCSKVVQLRVEEMRHKEGQVLGNQEQLEKSGRALAGKSWAPERFACSSDDVAFLRRVGAKRKTQPEV